MKKTILGIFALIFLGAAPSWAKLNIVTSFPQDAAIVKAIAQDKADVKSLTLASQDPHAIQLKPNLAVMLNRADLLIVNGQDMELAWLPTALTNARNSEILEGAPGYLNPSEGVELIPYSPEELLSTPFFTTNIIAGTQSAGGGQVSVVRGNHHYWLDPANGLIVAQNIANKLAEIDPRNADFYQANLTQFQSALKERIAKWDAMMEPFKGTPLVSYHRDWIYLIKRHGLKHAGYIEPRETIPPSAAEMASLIQKMKAQKIPLIVTSPWQNLRLPKEVAKQTGATHLVLPSSVGEDVGVKDYFDLFEVVYGKLTDTLKGIQ
ncbi:metal ABC transporter substrate-binding protein [Candidatus Manganitrophus noduliformans]|uniref:Zinc ABC transporter substrate-binding protein n=1 Tax=Candidatus Manganitrophus noduliformans TaxID=2606439 RepID=A0A7X6DUG1_9BACT|nr:metal ABC transporter substrate-binding protein [Candidatus Manganitrophus noduliformans]NKE73203.1 zinc ABC transporter substrate-binding protein [Candidatus Manganitrophus noduliformans]